MNAGISERYPKTQKPRRPNGPPEPNTHQQCSSAITPAWRQRLGCNPTTSPQAGRRYSAGFTEGQRRFPYDQRNRRCGLHHRI